MKKYNVVIPLAGALHFCDVEAEDKEGAIETCFKLVNESDDPMRYFNGEWDLYKKLIEGNAFRASYSQAEANEG